jgi:hypothetical protein
MSLSLDATAAARIASTVRAVAWLVDLDFAPAMVRYTNWPLDVTVGANTYLGLGTLAEVGTVAESENTSAETITLGFQVQPAVLAATLASPENYRGRRVQLWLQLFDDAFQPAGAPVLRWAGTMQPVKVTREPSPATGGASTGRIELPCTRSGMARVRHAQGLRLSHAQQQQRYPGDLGLAYMHTLIEQPSLWLSKRFQEL